MKKSYIYVLLVVLISATSCSNKKETKGNTNDTITLRELSLDSVTIDSIENCSYTGYSGTCNDSLYFLDEQLSYYYTISPEGRVGSRKLGLGKSSKELPIHPMGASFSNQSGQLVTMDGSYDGYIYDGKVKKFLMQPKGEKDAYTSSSAYTLWDYIVMRNDKSYMYYNIFSDNETIGIFSNTKSYLEKAAIIMKVSLTDGKMSPIGHYSDYYVKNAGKVKHLPYYYFDVDDDGGFYVTYQADSLIYHFDSDFKLLGTFGFQGRNMDTQYSNPGTSIEDLGKAFQADLENKGYYYWIEHVGDYIFRSYKRFGKSTTDGLQIYKDDKLIGDVDVPHGFKVSGRVGPYFVTNIIIDEETNKLYFYRFKIDD